MHYNYFRNYDPGTGRYGQSDPLGLAAGDNTYGYAYQSPFVYIDRDGRLPIIVPIGFCVVGGVGPALGGDVSGAVLGCGISVLGGGAAAFGLKAGSPLISRIVGGLTASIVGGLSANGSNAAPSNPGPNNPDPQPHNPFPFEPFPDFNSPDPVDPDDLKNFCELNPSAPNCQSDPNDCP